MSANPELLLEKLMALPPQRLAEVEDFVDFLRTRDENSRAVAGQRLGDAMSKLDALELPPMTAGEVQREIEAVRAARRTAENADRR